MSRILQYGFTLPCPFIGILLALDKISWLLDENMLDIIRVVVSLAAFWIAIGETFCLICLLVCDLYPPLRFSKLTRYVDKILPKEDVKININKRESRAFYRAELCGKLKRFGIKTPRIDDHRTWANWFPHIMGLEGNCDLKEARELDPAKLLEDTAPPTY